MRKQDVIVSAINSRLKKTLQKYGIEMPAPARSTEEAVRNAKELDQENGNTFWMDLLSKEMGALVVAFKCLSIARRLPLVCSNLPTTLSGMLRWT